MDNGDGWPTVMGNAQRTGCTTEVLTPPLNLAWRFEKGDYFWGCPTIVENTVYIAQDRVYALDLNDGMLRWKSNKVNAFGRPIGSTVWEDTLFVCGQGSLFAVDTYTGAIKFSVPVEGRGTSIPCIYQGVVFWVSVWGSLIAADARTGRIRWTYDTDSTTRFSPSVANGIIYFANERYVYALDATVGKVKWQWCFSPDPIPTSSPLHSAAVYGDTLLVSLRDSGLYALDIATGEVQWRYETKYGPFTAPSVGDGVAYVASRQLHAVNVSTGQELWTSKHGGGLTGSAPIISGDTVYIGGGIYSAINAFDRHTGEKIWKYATGDSVYVTGAIASGRLLIGSHDGYLYCFEEAR